jgi:hypothetical protein
MLFKEVISVYSEQRESYKTQKYKMKLLIVKAAGICSYQLALEG